MSSYDVVETVNDHFAQYAKPCLDLTTLPAYTPSPSPLPNVQTFDIANKFLRFKSKSLTWLKSKKKFQLN